MYNWVPLYNMLTKLQHATESDYQLPSPSHSTKIDATALLQTVPMLKQEVERLRIGSDSSG